MILEDVVAENFPPEERKKAKARILDARSAEMFQGSKERGAKHER